MKTVCALNSCTNCKACKDACPVHAIEIEDNLKAYNAVIDVNKCIECNKCMTVCQIHSRIQTQKPIVWKQGWSKNDSVRRKSASGGAATEIMRSFIKNQGIVCACTFKDGRFAFDFAYEESEIAKFMGSKYVKSDMEGVYHKVKEQLSSGKKVLFVGLPCQVAALKKYIGKKQIDGLYTVDLICHGTPSVQILKIFLAQNEMYLEQLHNIRFRKKLCYKDIEDYKEIATTGTCDPYTLGFLKGLFYTENCYQCQYASTERVSDITLGDSWGSELEEKEGEKGISLVLCQNEKGLTLVRDAELDCYDVDVETAVANNHQLREASAKHKATDKFFIDIAKGKKFSRTVFECMPIPYSKQMIKRILIRSGSLKLRGVAYGIGCLKKK